MNRLKLRNINLKNKWTSDSQTKAGQDHTVAWNFQEACAEAVCGACVSHSLV